MDSHEQMRRLNFSDAQLKLIRRSVARSCTSEEFDEFMAIAALCGLDPLRRQIAPLVVSADDPTRRRLIPWTTIDGLRLIAARHKDYRPMEEAPIIEYDRERIDEAKNPLGIVRAEVRAWKAFGDAWHAVVGEAWWDEFAPMRGANFTAGSAVAAQSDPEASARPTADSVLDTTWRRMSRVMIAKCAEAQALRRGWPDLFSGLYGEEELHALRLAEHTASELLQRRREQEKRARSEQRTLWFVTKPGASFEPISAGDVESVVGRIYLAAKNSVDIERFDKENRASLSTFWEWMPREAFRLKSMGEALKAALASAGEDADEAGSLVESAPSASNHAISGTEVCEVVEK